MFIFCDDILQCTYCSLVSERPARLQVENTMFNNARLQVENTMFNNARLQVENTMFNNARL